MERISYLDLFNATSILIPILFGLKNLAKSNLEYKVFWLYLLVGFIVGCLLLYLDQAGKENNIYQHLFSLFEGLVLFWLAYRWSVSATFKLMLKIFALIELAFFIYYIGWLDNWWKPVSMADIVRDSMLVPVMAYLCYDISSYSRIDLLKNYRFILSFAIFVNIAMSNIQLSLGTVLLEGNTYAQDYTIYFLYLANFVAYFLIILGFRCYPPRQIS